MIVNLNDDVRSLLQVHRDAFREASRRRAWRPSAEARRRQKAGHTEAVVALTRFGGIAAASRSGAIGEHECVMHGSAAAGTELERSHVSIADDRRRQYETSIHVRAVGRDRERLWHFDNGIRRAELPI